MISMVTSKWCSSARHRLRRHHFLSFPLPFQRSTDSNGPDHVYRSSDLGEPRLSGSQCCDKSSRFFHNHKHTQQISPIYQHRALVNHLHTLCVSTSHKNSLGVGQSIAVRELVGVLLAKHMAHTRARDNLQGSLAHPHSK